jgi:hypothetical protein
MDKKTDMAEIKKMPMEEKLALLGESDKAYIRGYIDRAVAEQKRVQKKRTAKSGGK